jgi:triacylglycerol esterase/lipase EstA (alpha/beta hydrolase family)
MSHPPSPDPADSVATSLPVSGYCSALKTGFQETTRRVQEMHRAIADLSFQASRWIPGMAGPVRLAQSAHDAIADGIYAAIRQSGGGLLAAAALLEQHAAARAPAEAAPPSRLATGLRSALNAAVGDHLASNANPLAITMGFYAAGHRIPLTADGLRAQFPDPGDRLGVFIHGLGCDEHSWQPSAEIAEDPSSHPYGARLQADLGYTPLYLRYNTGLPIADNGRQLERLLSDLLAVWPRPVRELVLIGHSMGGLVARGACDEAAAENLPWLKPTRMVICLGSPHRGSPLAKLGHLTTAALHLSKVTAPLGKIAAARSAGVRDLRHGLRAQEERTQAAAVASGVAYRFISANLTEDPDHPLGHILGDGLVTLHSATVPELSDDVDSVRLGGLGHMALLNEPRVYERIRQWLETPGERGQ